MSEMNNKTSRRRFLQKTSMATAGIALSANGLNALNYERISGANEKIRVGFIGVGNRGSQMLAYS